MANMVNTASALGVEERRLTEIQLSKGFAVETLNTTVEFVRDLKLGHYVKVPPRVTFWGEQPSVYRARALFLTPMFQPSSSPPYWLGFWRLDSSRSYSTNTGISVLRVNHSTLPVREAESSSRRPFSGVSSDPVANSDLGPFTIRCSMGQSLELSYLCRSGFGEGGTRTRFSQRFRRRCGLLIQFSFLPYLESMLRRTLRWGSYSSML